MDEPIRTLFTRHGHLTSLTLERFEAGELESQAHTLALHHVETCTRCADELESILNSPCLAPPNETQPLPTSSLWFASSAFAGLAIAASLLLVLRPTPEQATRTTTEVTWNASAYTSTTDDEADGWQNPLVVQQRAHERNVTLKIHSITDGFVGVLSTEFEDTDGGTGGLGFAPPDVYTPVGPFNPATLELETSEFPVTLVWCPNTSLLDELVDATEQGCAVQTVAQP